MSLDRSDSICLFVFSTLPQVPYSHIGMYVINVTWRSGTTKLDNIHQSIDNKHFEYTTYNQ
jgi:hypothetical protein